MSDEKRCLRCGSCCRYVVLLKSAMSPESRKYMECRGLEEDQGFFLIPHVCQHLYIKKGGLQNLNTGEIIEPRTYYCDIHDSPDRPAVCVKWHGQKRIGNQMIYCPTGCGFRKGKEK